MPFPASGRCLVTGATGFLGTALVRALLAAGVVPERLRCLCRDPARAVASGLPAAAVVAGDVTDPESLRSAVRGADIVFHLAGTVKATRPAGYFGVNRDGSRHLAAAVASAAPDAFVVVVSSLAAAGPSVDGAGSANAASACRPVSAYGESKRQGELAFANQRRVAIVRPPIIYGSGDAATRLLFAQATAPVTFVPPRPSPLSIVHVDDVVTALLRTASVQPAGAVLPLDGPERTDSHRLLRAIAAACDRRARLVPIPLAIAAGAALGADLWARLTGHPSFFNGDKVKELRAAGWVADPTPARQLLDFTASTPLAAGLLATAIAEGRRRATSAAASAAPSARASDSPPGRR